MSELLVDILKTIVPSLVVAITTAFLTVRLSLRRFHAERWWERKEAAYSSLIDVVHRLKEYARHHYERELGGEDPTEEEKETIENQWKKTNAEYRRLRDLASFHVSAETVEILQRYDEQKSLARSDDIFEWIEKDLEATTHCLEALITDARRDLRAQ
ncbi:MAG: hypothetical protein U5R46_15330 [Gammaproteobacteria bacterium]|nr:hypothetical protein [Gammaproteobacteria bacterium]